LRVDGCDSFYQDDVALEGVLCQHDVTDPDSCALKSMGVNQDMIRWLQHRGHAGPLNAIPASALKRPHDQIERLVF